MPAGRGRGGRTWVAFVLGTYMPVQGRTPPSYGALSDVATRQHGVVSMKQLQELGYAKSTVIEWVASGRIHPLHRGVYAVGHRRLSWHSRCWAAVLAAEANEVDGVVWPAVASHGSAAYLWGLYRYAPERVDVTAPIRRRAKRRFVVHFSSILAPEDRGEREGIPVTSVARTLLDLAIRAAPRQLERLLERAEEIELLDLHKVEDVLDRAGGHRGRAGCGGRSPSISPTPPSLAPASRGSSAASSSAPASPPRR